MISFETFTPMQDLPKFKQELRDARQEVRNLTVMEMSPDLLPREQELVRNLLRMARVEVKLRLKHLRWARQQAPNLVRP